MKSVIQRCGALTARNLQLSKAAPVAYLEHRRFLNLHEYQSKELMRKYGVNVQKGLTADTPEQALEVSNKLKKDGAVDLILKCQVLAGGRGKGKLTSGLQGGVKICSTGEEVKEYAKQMLGYRLITHQTMADGEPVDKVLIHEGVNIEKEFYLAILLDRASLGPVFVASKMGGMDIEEVANTNPEAIVKVPIDVVKGVTPETCKNVSEALGLDDSDGVVSTQLKNLYKMFLECDATQVEINPFAVTDVKTGPNRLMNVDAKIEFDDSAKYRQKELFDMEDTTTRDGNELKAEAVGLNYVGMDGSIGCLVNGAGLAMSTMDIIQLHGGTPANFLDVGGGADVDQVEEAFRILTSHGNVKAVFVNIFGGIMRCDTIAKGLVEAAKNVDLSVPLVVRLVGNQVDAGKKILQDSGIKCQVIDDFEKAAEAACKAAK